ncbi:hypothetical protein P4311_07455 [Bacillus thuringiensis]|nr:hypothetical protein [Bacillus thuringiensis]MRB59378.1 hypothetical protein [Bacillus thuringiensis]
MELPLEELNEIKAEFDNIFNNVKEAYDNTDIEKGKQSLEAYKACYIKLGKLVVTTGFIYSPEFGGYHEKLQLEHISPINNRARIGKLMEAVREERYYLQEKIETVEHRIEIGLPITRQLIDNKYLTQPEYDRIILDIHNYGMQMTATSTSYKKLNENDIRNTILNTLNTIYPKLNSTGESFNRDGLTDILIKDKNKTSIFMAECKCWDGTKYSINKGLKQLIRKYTTIHDRKLSLIIFNKDTNVSTVTKCIENDVPAYLKRIKLNPKRIHRFSEPYLYSFEIDHPRSSDKTAQLTVILININ